MAYQWSRAQRRFLNLHGIEKPYYAEIYTTISFAQPAERFLQLQMTSAGVYRSGPLFGRRDGETIHVDHAAVSGILPLCETPGEPFAFNSQYILGFSDALRATYNEVDWVGHWMIQPHNRLPKEAELWNYLEQAANLDLIDIDHPLVFVGVEQSEMHLRPYSFMRGVGGQLLDVE